MDALRRGATPASRARPGPPARRRAGGGQADEAHGELAGAEFTSDEVPIAPQRVIRLLQETFPEDGIVTCDAGENRLFMMHWYRPKSAEQLPAARRRRRHGLRRAGGDGGQARLARTVRCWPCAATAGSPCPSTPS